MTTPIEIPKELCQHMSICRAQFLESIIVSQSPYRVRTLESLCQRGTLYFSWVPGLFLTQKVETFVLSSASCPAATVSLIRSLGLAHCSKDSRGYVWGISHIPTAGTATKSASSLAQKHYKESHTGSNKQPGVLNYVFSDPLITLIPDKMLCLYKYNF